MNTIVIEHMRIADPPPACRPRMEQAAGTTATVRIEEGAQATPAEPFETDDPQFGMWRDRDDTADPAGYVRSMCTSRFNDDGTKRTD